MGKPTIERLREHVRGAVIIADDESYDEARRVHNAMIDKRPRVVVRPANAGDVGAAVDFARENELDLAVRGGGDSVSWLRHVRRRRCGGFVVDAERDGQSGNSDSARRGWRNVGRLQRRNVPPRPCHDGRHHLDNGVGGLTLGGGIGYLARGLGLSCDNLISAEVVTADGRLLVANDRENEDLFWALRGGSGNFGVVTSFEFRLSPVKDIYGGPIFFELDRAGDVLRFFREFIVDAPEQLGGFPAFQIAPPLPFIPENRHGEPFVAIVACWAGPLDDGERAVQPFRDVAPIVAELVGPMPYPALNSAFDGLVPPGLQHYLEGQLQQGVDGRCY